MSLLIGKSYFITAPPRTPFHASRTGHQRVQFLLRLGSQAAQFAHLGLQAAEVCDDAAVGKTRKIAKGHESAEGETAEVIFCHRGHTCPGGYASDRGEHRGKEKRSRRRGRYLLLERDLFPRFNQFV